MTEDLFLYNLPFPKTLQEWQESPLVHPYTCSNRGDGYHLENDRDLGVLEVTGPSTLYCPTCDYTQELDDERMKKFHPNG